MRPVPPTTCFGNIVQFRVKERHTGENLAGIAADCIKRYGLEDKVRQNTTRHPWTIANVYWIAPRCLYG